MNHVPVTTLIDRSPWLAANKQKAPPAKKTPPSKDKGGKGKGSGKDVVRTQMMGEHGDDDLGYDPRIIPTERIVDDE
jgi:hypothetical protein